MFTQKGFQLLKCLIYFVCRIIKVKILSLAVEKQCEYFPFIQSNPFEGEVIINYQLSIIDY